MRPAFERVIMVDWSAASTPGPPRPAPDRCWLAWADARSDPRRRPAPVYCRTRTEACARVLSLASGCPGRVLVGLDFPFGYPRDAGLPSGRELCRLLAGLIRDEPDGANNRFEAAARLNRIVADRLGVPAGPFWGCARGVSVSGLTARRPVPYPVPEYRRVEALLRARGRYPQPAFKLAGVGSVGSQTLLGLAAVHRLLADPALSRRGVLWPFETGAGLVADAVVFAEIWPSLGAHRARRHAIKDARQVAAARDEMLDAGHDPLRVPAEELGIAASEGWILGAPVAGPTPAPR